MSQDLKFKSIAALLVNGEPLSFKAYPDGSLVVVAPTGQKFRFSAAQIQEAENQLKPKPKPKPKSTASNKTRSKTTAKRGRPSKTAPDPKKVKS